MLFLEDAVVYSIFPIVPVFLEERAPDVTLGFRVGLTLSLRVEEEEEVAREGLLVLDSLESSEHLQAASNGSMHWPLSVSNAVPLAQGHIKIRLLSHL